MFVKIILDFLSNTQPCEITENLLYLIFFPIYDTVQFDILFYKITDGFLLFFRTQHVVQMF